MTGMSTIFGRHSRMVGVAGVTLAYSAVSLSLPPGQALKVFADISQLLLLLAATAVMMRNTFQARGHARTFWGLMTTGCAMWTANMALWALYEVVLHREIPDPFVGDVILFLHIVPFMAAVAMRPHRSLEEQKLHFSTLNSLLLLAWWVFLYAFIVFPDEYVSLNVPLYTRNSNLLYLVENVALLATLGVLALAIHGAWKKIYWNLFVASGLYTLSSEAMNTAIARSQYHSGSLYDVPFVASICWLISAGLLAGHVQPTCDPGPPAQRRWLSLAPRLARLAILSLPVMGYWAWFRDTAPLRLRLFRLLVMLAAMLVMGLFVFVRQYLLDRELVRLLGDSRRSLENLQRLQTQLVQKEKLASLGQLVAGAAHEINRPLEAILQFSGVLAGQEGLGDKQIDMTQKIGQQARRAQELVSSLLSFSQQSPREKNLVEVRVLLQRALQMEMLQMESKKIRVQSNIAPALPPIWGNANQLFQCCLEIIGNAADALEEAPGGSFSVSARQEGDEVVLEFADSGPGIRDPQRVFDPFYTTKPIGKGTGLGLSATYGVVQDHKAHIACHNRPEGGAVFVLRFPVARQTAAVEVAQAAKA